MLFLRIFRNGGRPIFLGSLLYGYKGQQKIPESQKRLRLCTLHPYLLPCQYVSMNVVMPYSSFGFEDFPIPGEEDGTRIGC
ncbi:hypothetical protein ACLOJK_039777 [Asimina triloba]